MGRIENDKKQYVLRQRMATEAAFKCLKMLINREARERNSYTQVGNERKKNVRLEKYRKNRLESFANE